MRWGIAAAVAAIIGLAFALWPPIPVGQPPQLRAEPAIAPISTAQPSAEGRVFLSAAQRQQALVSGTFDRPVQSLLAVPKPLHFGDYSWIDKGVPAGPSWIRIDLGHQIISIFRAGHEIGTAVIVYGGDNKQTPIGRLHILGKAQNHRSSLYDADMPYTLRLTDDGVSIHASTVRWGAATHGCIGVPMDFARRLFAAANVGDEVVIVPPARDRGSAPS